RVHQKMEQVYPVGHSVDEIFESTNLAQADDIYSAWTKFVIGKTRDVSQFPLLFKENMAYGFRRNLWGMKPYAIALIVVLMLLAYVLTGGNTNVWKLDSMPEVFYVAESFLLLFLSFWVIIVR